MCLNETWLNEKYLPKFVGYTSIWKNRAGRGGGVGEVIKLGTQYQTVNLNPYNNGILETQAIKIAYGRQNDYVYVFNFYNPNGNVRLTEVRHYTAQLGEKFIMVGDMNAHCDVLNSTCIKANPTGKSL
jgi:exonuclease III